MILYFGIGEKAMKYYDEFVNWLNKHLSKDIPTNILAINFNLYESSEQTYDIQMTGSDEFDEKDEDWACNTVFSTDEDLFVISRTDDISEWQQGIIFISALVQKYLESGMYAEKLKSYKAVGIGFVDGDIDILYRSN